MKAGHQGRQDANQAQFLEPTTADSRSARLYRSVLRLICPAGARRSWFVMLLYLWAPLLRLGKFDDRPYRLSPKAGQARGS